MEEEKDQLLKRVERLKKRVRPSDPAGSFVPLVLGIKTWPPGCGAA